MSAVRKILRQRIAAVLITIAALISLTARGVEATDDKDSVRISSVQAYEAQQIESGNVVGHLLHVQAHVTVTAATRARLKLVVNVPIVLEPRLEVNGRQLPPSGAGGLLPQMISLLSLDPCEGGERISPLFYVPSGTLENTDVVDLVMGIDNDGWGPLEPLARAPVPWTKELVEEAGAAHIALMSVATKERLEDDEGSIRLKHRIQLRLPLGLTRVLGGGNGKLYCGDKQAEGLNIGILGDILGDIVDAWFSSPVDALNDRWELQFPSLGVKLELEMSKP